MFILREHQQFPIGITEAWSFFANPKNLVQITPPSLNLMVTNDIPDEMHEGMIITYAITPILMIKLNWVTEITSMNPPTSFIDEQRFGPYKFWHHQHSFREIRGGVEVTDEIHYMLRGGPFATLINDLIVRRRLKKIFEYRATVLSEKLGVMEKPPPLNNAGGQWVND